MARESKPTRLARLAVQWETASEDLKDLTLPAILPCPLPPVVEEACRTALHPAAADAYDALQPVERWNRASLLIGALHASPTALDVVERELYGGPLLPLDRRPRPLLRLDPNACPHT